MFFGRERSLAKVSMLEQKMFQNTNSFCSCFPLPVLGSNSKSNALGHGEMVSLDESSFPALELNNRRMSVKNSFCRKNGIYTRYQWLPDSLEEAGGGGGKLIWERPLALPFNTGFLLNDISRASVSLPRSPPRPSPGSLHYSDEDVTKYNDLIPAESSSLTEKPSEISDSQVSHARGLEVERFSAAILQRVLGMSQSPFEREWSTSTPEWAFKVPPKQTFAATPC